MKPPNELTDQLPHLNTEVQDYLSDLLLHKEKDPLRFWISNQSRYPHLANIAARYLSSPASSAPVERLFIIKGGKFLGRKDADCLMKYSKN